MEYTVQDMCLGQKVLRTGPWANVHLDKLSQTNVHHEKVNPDIITPFPEDKREPAQNDTQTKNQKKKSQTCQVFY